MFRYSTGVRGEYMYKGIYICGRKEKEIKIRETLDRYFFERKETITITTRSSNNYSGMDNLMVVYIYEKPTDFNSEPDWVQQNTTYKICYTNMEYVCKLIYTLWDKQNCGGGLSHRIIKEMINCDMLIQNGKDENVSNASYDLSLGAEYYYAGKIETLTEKNPFLAIEPYDYAITSCEERIMMPRDISARFDVSVNLFCQGVILSNSTQVDPGFEGKLVCLLFNTSNKVVYLKKGAHFTTIEFNKLIEPTTAYHGQYTDEESIVQYLPVNSMQGGINELKKEIEELKTNAAKMQSIYISALSIFVAILSIMLVLK